MCLAYLILAHKQPSQVERLFRAIYHPDDLIVMHGDRRAPRELHALTARLAQQHANVSVLKPRAILWSGYEMTAVQLEAMRVADARRDVPWHHFINLTGQDFPLKPRDQIEARLGEDRVANYVTWFDPLVKPLWTNARARMDRYYLEWAWLQQLLFLPGVGRRVRRIFGWSTRPFVPLYHRKWPSFFRYYGGGNHVILSRAAAQYLTSAPEAQRIIRWLRHTLHANEILFQSVLLNSLYSSTVVNEHLREVEFERPENPHPRIWHAEDYDRLVNSRLLFARKFDENVDSEILTLLERHLSSTADGAPLLNRTPRSVESKIGAAPGAAPGKPPPREEEMDSPLRERPEVAERHDREHRG